jgi:uncharacterized protein YceK
MLKISTCISLSLLFLILFLIPGCITINTATEQTQPSSSQSGQGEPNSASNNGTVDVQETQPAQAFAVVDLIIGTEPSSGPCPEILYADITTNGAGTVNYRWESTEGQGYSYTFSEIFASEGTQRVTLIEEMRALPSGIYQIHVLSPNDIISNTTHYTTCAQ